MGGLPFLDLAASKTTGVPAHQRLQPRVRRRPRRTAPARRRSRAARGRRRWPSGVPPPRWRAGPSGPSSSQVSSSTTAAYPPVATGSAPGVATTIAGRSSTVASTPSPEDDVRTRTPGRARPSSSAVRASPSTGARSPWPPHSAQRQPGATVAHQAHSGGRCGSAQAERSVADAAQGRRTASVAGEPGRVADARCLHEHRSGLHGIAQQRVRLGRHPGRPCARVALEVVVGVAGEVHRDALAYDVARRHDLGGPPGAEEVLRLHAARVRRQHGRAAGLLGAHEQHLAGMGVRRPRLVVEVVAVVPDRHQPEVLHRREHGGAGADHDAHGPAADRQERAVALRRAGVGRQHHVAALPQPLGERRVETSHVAVVGNADERAPAGRSRRHDGLGEDLGPVVAGQHRPHGPRRLPGREPLQHGRAIGIVARGPRDGPPRSTSGGRLGGLLLDRRVPGRDGQPEDVGADAGVPRGHGAGQRRDVGGEHALGADHPAQRLQPTGVLGGRRPRDHEAVDVLPGEPHLDPHPRLRVGGSSSPGRRSRRAGRGARAVRRRAPAPPGRPRHAGRASSPSAA